MNEIIENMNKNDKFLSDYATKNNEAIRINNEEKDIRSSFFRDIDRIIYSLSYTRYIDKTQVFSNIENDNISKRMTHVQMVSKIARTIGRALNLNEDLIEAIALGHDLGHVPFGHTGEAILNRISIDYSGRMFNHNVHSIRTLMNVEDNGKGSNITIQVLDGILCHNGEFIQDQYYPIDKTIDQFLDIYEKCYTDPSILKTLRPMTLEGCVVRISDIVGYIGRDIEDAIRLGVLSVDEIPNNIIEVLGKTNKEIINTIILDIVGHSINQPYIKMSSEVYKAIKDLKEFNYAHIYEKANNEEQLEKYEIMFKSLFEMYLENIKDKNSDTDIYQVFLGNMNDKYLINTSDEQKVIDFIAGMTDDYFINQYNKYFQKN